MKTPKPIRFEVYNDAGTVKAFTSKKLAYDFALTLNRELGTSLDINTKHFVRHIYP
jgi:hypothetical protein